jgi:hypothetical protein
MHDAANFAGTAFESLEEARVALLCNAVRLASSSSESFAVIGGWSPFLLNSAPIPHPGTADVDLLFAEGVTPGRLKRAYELFLAAGYHPSAKHPFQLVQIIKVGAEELAFNIDILHPNEQGRRGMFADHIELPVPLTPFLKQQLRMKSIAVPASRFIFTYQRIRTVSVEQTASSGEKMATAVPVMDEAGLIVTKSYSFRNPKRSRDLFDIYLAVKQCGDRPEVTSFLRRLKKEVPDTFNTLHAIEAAMTRTPGLLASVNEHLPEPLREPEDSILACLVAFLREAGVDAVDDAACQEDVVLE